MKSFRQSLFKVNSFMKIPSKKYILLFFCFAASIWLVIIVFRYSKNENHRNNDFTRLIPTLILYQTQNNLNLLIIPFI